MAILTNMSESILGMKGLTLRNTFLEFKDEEDTLTLDGFNRQASEPAKPPSMQQLSEQRGTTDGAFNFVGSMPSRNATAAPSPEFHPPKDFQFYGEPTSDEHPSSMGMAAGLSPSVWEAALMAVQQTMTPLPHPLQPVPAKFLRMGSAPAATGAVAARGPSFCPRCGSKVMDSSHRFCAYCCFPLKDLQHESMPEAHPVAAPPPDMSFPVDLGLAMRQGMTLNPASADLTAAALIAQHQALQHGFQSIGTERRSTYPEQDNIMKSLRHFRYVDAKELDIEHAKAVCLSYLSASGRKGGGVRRPIR